jgi:hypothetical protein
LFATIAGVMRKHHRQLDASVGASGPHGFAVRKQCHSSFDIARVHRIPSRVRDDREPPLWWDGTATQYSCFYPSVNRNSENQKLSKAPFEATRWQLTQRKAQILSVFTTISLVILSFL